MKPASRFVLLPAFSLAAGTSQTEADEAASNKAGNSPAGSLDRWCGDTYQSGSWSARDQVPATQTRNVVRPSLASPLPCAASPQGIVYGYRSHRSPPADDLDRQCASGLLVPKKRTIVNENCCYCRRDMARFVLFSRARSVTLLRVASAASLGLTASLDGDLTPY